MLRRTGVTVLAGVLLAACASGGPERADPSPSTQPTTPTTAPTTTTTVELPPPVPVDWQRCGSGFQCGTVLVPVDYARPDGATLELALVRRPAGRPDERLGTLLVNPGGPGSSGVARVRRGFTVSPEVAQRFDIVGFDPRGIGASTPISCGAAVPAFRATDLAPDTPEEQAELEAAAAAVAAECAATEGERLAHLGTIDVAHDVEVIRRAIGEPQIGFVGLSYGTLIGLLWAEAYPDSVRALVLDGVVDPASGGDATSEAQIDAVDDLFDQMASRCATDPACPLTDDGGLHAAYDELARRVEAGAGRPAVGPTQLAYAALYATYDVEHWPDLSRAVDRGLRGSFDGVAAMAASFTGLVSYAPFALVTCLDTPHATDLASWREDAAAGAERSPRFGAVLANELLPCASWPASRFVPHDVVAPGTPPVLVLGSTGDAATPFEQAERVADKLAAGVLLTIEIDGHVAIGDSDCATEAVTRYLVDGTLPDAGTRCPET